jgi:hypothetical protein
MKHTKNILYVICLSIALAALLGCEAMADLFHGPKPEEEVPAFTVTFDANGANGTAPAPQTAAAETVIPLPGEGALVFSGKTFTGWSVSPGGAGTTYGAGYLFPVTGDQTLYARWVTTGDIQQYTIIFNANGASGAPPAPQTVYSGISMSVPHQGSLVQSGKEFTGWNTAADGTGTNYAAGAALTVAANMTLYAQWLDPDAKTYTVTYHANEAGGTPPAARTVAEGSGITLPGAGGLASSGKTFGGWNTKADGSGTAYATGTNYTVSANATLYAQWESVPIDPSGSTLSQKLAYIRNNAGDGVVYDILIDKNEYLGPESVSTLGRNITVNIHSSSSADVKSIQLESQGHLFSIGTNVTLKLENIVLKGISTNNNALVLVGQGGGLILNSGSKITLNTNRGNENGGGVFVNGGTIEMNDGSEIIENSVINSWAYGGGINVGNRGNGIIRGGIISGNYLNTGSSWRAAGGGINVTGNSTVTMSGGSISKNECAGWAPRGGGINIDSGSTFTKRATTGGTTSGIIYGSTGDEANILTPGAFNDGGYALFRFFSSSISKSRRNYTLGYYDEISTLTDDGWEQ